MSDDDPFDEGIPRDGRGRPLIIPIVRNKPKPDGKLIPYTRVSTFAKALDSGSGLTRWKVRHAVLGVAISADLATMAGALGRNVNDLGDGDKKTLDEIADRAHDRSGGNNKADYGTAVHAMTEPDRDPFMPAEPATYQRDVAAHDALLAELGLEVAATEQFVINDEVKAAGTFDHAYRLTRGLDAGEMHLEAGAVVIGDKKTGTLHMGQHAIQLAVYARGKTYDHVTGERTAVDVSPQWGIVVHIPKGEGKAAAYLVDLHRGWEGAKLAEKVRAYRSAERSMGKLIAEIVADHAPKVDEAPAEAVEAEAVEAEAVEAEVVDSEVVDSEVVDSGNAEVPPATETGTPADEVVEAEVVDDFGDPINPPDIADAVANLARAGLEPTDAILDQIGKAETGEALRLLWGENRRAWTDAHTAAVKARLAELGAQAAA